jgi:hypothetical protein
MGAGITDVGWSNTPLLGHLTKQPLRAYWYPLLFCRVHAFVGCAQQDHSADGTYVYYAMRARRITNAYVGGEVALVDPQPARRGGHHHSAPVAQLPDACQKRGTLIES